MKPNLGKTIVRCLRLRCPHCGIGHLVKSWRETHDECSHCGFDFRVEGGFYLGSIYLNYGLMAAVSLGVGMPLVWFQVVSPAIVVSVGAVLCVLLAVWFWRYARALWLGFGYYIDHNVRAGSQDAATPTKSPERGKTGLTADENALSCACSYCHKRFSISESQKHSWGTCPFCQARILLAPIVS
ncbi:DUF983 domain-containing protein [Pirellulales bacterium]|nr:DUF983 domain-containing protein [Pirellulales bacterium]